MIVPLAIASVAGYALYRFLRDRMQGPAYVPATRDDTMSAIAARFGVPVEAIVAANGPGFARFYAPNGQPVPFKLPSGLTDNGPRDGAQGKYIP